MSKMDERILKIHYGGNCVRVKVDDIDRCLLIDVLNEMCEEFKKSEVELPTYPGLHYCFREKSISLVDDGTLMKMFENITLKEIDVWVGCLAKPSFIWNLAQTVRKAQNPIVGPPENLNDVQAQSLHMATIEPGPQQTEPGPQQTEPGPQQPPTHVKHIISVLSSTQQPIQKLPIRRNPPPSCEVHRRKLPKLLEEISPDSPPHVSLASPYENISDSQLSSPPPRRSPRFLQGVPSPNLKKAPVYPAKPIPTESPPTTKSRVRSKVELFPHGRKMAHSTARYKGVPIQSTLYAQPTATEGDSIRTRPRRRVAEVDVQHGQIESGSESEEGTSSGSDSDGEYQPPVEDDEEDGISEDDQEGLDEENPIDLLNQNFVDGNWEPFRCNEAVYEDAGDYVSRLYKNGELFDDAQLGVIRLKPWQLFVDRDHFKDALRDYCVQEGFSLVVRRSEQDRYTAECADSRCTWRIHASVLIDGCTWAIKSIKNGHSCDLNMVNNPMVTCAWAAQKLVEDIRATPDIRGKALNNLLWEKFGVRMARSSLYKMKGLAMEMIQGGHDDSYGQLAGYCEMIKDTNQGSIAFCLWKTLQQPERTLQFKCIFISFAAQFNGVINGCRGLVGVDGCHLKGNYGGVLLSAVSLDGNNEIFPVAVAVVDSENKSSWSWFFTHLKNILTQTGRDDWTIMSDRQKGIDPALDQVWPTCDRRYCARHLCKNFKTEYPGVVMHKLFWAVTNAFSAFSFKKALQQVQKAAGLGAVKWFKDLGPLERWTKFKFDPNLCCDENTNNFVESFNSTIGVDRTYPILTLLEGVRRIAMVRHATRQQLSEQWKDEGVCPNIRERVRAVRRESRLCHAYPSGRGEFEISDGRSMLPVSLNTKSCVCGRWQIEGIPCRHGVRAILHDGKEPLDFVSEWYSVSRYKAAYKGNILPIPDPQHWPDLDVPKLIPPTMKRSVGRPSRNRRREEGEQRKGKRSSTVQCGKCKQFGHKTLTCKGGLTKKEIQERSGLFKTKEAANTRKSSRQPSSQDGDDGNFIDMMVSQASASPHVPRACSSQPVPSTTNTRTRSRQATFHGEASTQPEPTTTAAAANNEEGYISPKRRKILNRLSQL